MVSVEQMKIAILGAVNQGVYANDSYWWKQLKRLAGEIESEALCPTPRALDGADWWDCECGVSNHPSWQACQFCKYPRRQ